MQNAKCKRRTSQPVSFACCILNFELQRRDHYAEIKDTPGRRQAVQEDRHGQDRPLVSLQASHPDGQDDEVEATDARYARSRRAGRAEAESDAAVQVEGGDARFKMQNANAVNFATTS